MPAGIFGLKKTYKKQVLDAWPELSVFGYFAGGYTSGNQSTIDRLDFSNETVGRSNNLTQARYVLAAVSNSNYGYFGGGIAASTVCTIDRLDFSNETVAAPGTYQLTEGRWGLAGVSNSNYGYFGGGSYVCTIDRLDFSNETVSAPTVTPGQLTQARGRLAAVSNSNYGYFGGGDAASPVVNIIDRLDFSNETVAAPGTYQLTQARKELAAVSNSNYGYFGGGGTPTNVSTIDRLDFSSETVAAPGNYQLTQARTSLAAVSNSNYGYFGGGSGTNTIDRLDFSNETISAPTGYYLTQGRQDLSAVSTKQTTETVRKVRRGEFDSSGLVYSNYGYFGGGLAPSLPGRVCTIDRLDFSNETLAAPGISPGQLTKARDRLAAVSNSNYGYFGGGSNPGNPPSPYCTIDRLDFSSETVAAPGNYQLTQARDDLAAVSTPQYGYFAGGFAPPLVNTIDRLDFSNETTSAPGNNLTILVSEQAAVSNSNYGYFAGGFTPPKVNTIDRLDFATETVEAPGTYQLTEARSILAAVSNSNYGYFCGGERSGSPSVVCTIDRLDFSNETVSAPGNKLTQARNALAAVSNSNYGYFAGGEVTTGDLLDFSTETVTGPPIHGINLTQARNNLAGTNIPLNQTRHVAPQAVVGVSTFFHNYGKSENTVSYGFGYFAGGRTLPFVCTIDRLDFSSETTSAPGNNLTQERTQLAAVSNSNYGYFGGGETYTCTIDRLDFSNETIQFPVTVQQLTQARAGLTAVSSPRGYGYFAGGANPGNTPSPYCIIDRLDFSNETIQFPVTVEQLTQARFSLAAVSNSNYGYFGGGLAPSVPGRTCTIDRLDFSNETIQFPVTVEQLTQARNGLAAVSNSNYGYFGGGSGPGIPGNVCTIDRLDFTTETTSNPPANLTQARDGLAAVYNSNYGYFGGGAIGPTPSEVSTIDRLDFSNETIAAPTGYYLTQARELLAGTQVNYYRKVGRPISKSYGYFADGESPGPNYYCTIDRLDFSSETVSAPGNNLTQARTQLTAVSTSQYGYFAGGFVSPFVNTIDRLDFSNETTSNPPANLTQARSQLEAVSNSNYGYFGGGTVNLNTIDRLDFSNETVSAPGNNLAQGRRQLAAVSNSNYGYFGGGDDGSTSICTIDRLDFSNETVAAPGNYQLTQARENLAAVSNSNYGYFGGGYDQPIASIVFTIDRLDFSNETTSNPPAALTQARAYLAAVSNSNYGYFGGGYVLGVVCTIDRLDFSSETTSAPGTYQLTEARYYLAAVSN